MQPPKISLPSSDNAGSMDSIKGTFLCVFPRELVGMQAECVAAYVRLTRLPPIFAISPIQPSSLTPDLPWPPSPIPPYQNFITNDIKQIQLGVGDASLRMHRLHDVLQFFETSLKNRIVKN